MLCGGITCTPDWSHHSQLHTLQSSLKHTSTVTMETGTLPYCSTSSFITLSWPAIAAKCSGVNPYNNQRILPVTLAFKPLLKGFAATQTQNLGQSQDHMPHFNTNMRLYYRDLPPACVEPGWRCVQWEWGNSIYSDHNELKPGHIPRPDTQGQKPHHI